MNKAVRLKLYQNLCNYRKEGSFGYVQTYPLPTPSMIRGMAHSILDLDKYEPLEISIQGESEGIVTNIQRVYKFDRDPKSRPDNPYRIEVRNSIKTATHGILFVDLHIHIKLIIHINFFNQSLNEALIQKIHEKLIVLGRNEDIALLEDVKIVKLGEITSRTIESQYPMYVKSEALSEKIGTFLRLPFNYEDVKSFEDSRIFNFIEVSYIGKGTRDGLKKDHFYKDEEGYLINFLRV
ncbi:MAG: CRISPR-associated protein Cas5 [Spirochaetota bacterium]